MDCNKDARALRHNHHVSTWLEASARNTFVVGAALPKTNEPVEHSLSLLHLLPQRRSLLVAKLIQPQNLLQRPTESLQSIKLHTRNQHL